METHKKKPQSNTPTLNFPPPVRQRRECLDMGRNYLIDIKKNSQLEDDVYSVFVNFEEISWKN